MKPSRSAMVSAAARDPAMVSAARRRDTMVSAARRHSRLMVSAAARREPRFGHLGAVRLQLVTTSRSATFEKRDRDAHMDVRPGFGRAHGCAARFWARTWMCGPVLGGAHGCAARFWVAHMDVRPGFGWRTWMCGATLAGALGPDRQETFVITPVVERGGRPIRLVASRPVKPRLENAETFPDDICSLLPKTPLP
jgi:hypothetical protein